MTSRTDILARKDHDAMSQDEDGDNESTENIPDPKAKRKKLTRSSTDVFLVGKASDRIAGSQLPTGRQMFKYYIHLQNDAKIHKIKVINDEITYQVIDEVLVFWQMARIKTITRHNAAIKFRKFIEKHRKLTKSKDRVEDPGGLRKKFVEELDQLFDIGSNDAVEEIKKNRLLTDNAKNEDIAFYLDQQTTRQAHMSGHDKVFKTKLMKKLQRDSQQQKKRKDNYSIDASSSNAMDAAAAASNYSASDYSPSDSAQTDPTFESNSRESSLRSQYVHLVFPRNVLADEGICAAADRLGLSDNQTTSMVVAVLKAGGADIMKDFTISRCTARRNRICTRLSIQEETLDTFHELCPERCVIHWDGKNISNPLGSAPDESTEYLAVLVTCAPDYEEGKWLF